MTELEAEFDRRLTESRNSVHCDQDALIYEILVYLAAICLQLNAIAHSLERMADNTERA